jgi:hypothetical protein
MVDCLRIKGDTVTLVADSRDGQGRGWPRGCQLWRVASPTGHTTLWVSAMVRAGDFGLTTADTRAMPFPRVDTPDNPGWFPQGLSWSSLRHPIHNGRLFLRAKWNASRTDVLTFLGLRQPAWASDELFTLVAVNEGASITPPLEESTFRVVVQAHAAILAGLQRWSAETTSGAP